MIHTLPKQPDEMRAPFLDAMRCVAQAVTVVTTNGVAGRHGATVSAFNSITADPPSVFVCLKADSRIAQSVVENGQYCVNILSESESELASRFAGFLDNEISDRFDNIAFTEDAGGSPMLQGSTAFHCDLAEVVNHGSHQILIGRVKNIGKSDIKPLAYFNGRYHSVQPQI